MMTVFHPVLRLGIAAVALTSVVKGQEPDEVPGAPIRIQPVPEHLAAVDLDGDQQAELVSVVGSEICLLLGGECEPLSIPGRATLWTVADWSGNGVSQLLVLVDGKDLHELSLRDGAFDLGQPILSDLDGTPPLGVRPASFVRDLDANGYPDLVVPRADRVLIWHGTADGVVRGPEVAGMAKLMLEVGDREDGLLGQYERVYQVPEPSTQDVSGDGLPDLLVRDGDQVRQFLAGSQGFPAAPSVELSLDQFREEFDETQLDFSNLTKLLKYVVVDEWADLNGDDTLDLLVLSNGKVRIFLGNEGGVSLERSKRPVKLDGNIFFATVAEISEDGIPDLVLVGVEDLGLADLALSLVTSFKLRFDFYVFRGRGDGSFHPRVFRQREVVLEGGRLLSVIKENRTQLSALREVVVRVGNTDAGAERDDIILLDAEGKLGVWRNEAPSTVPIALMAEEFLREAFADKGTLSVDVATLTEWVLGRTSALIARTRQRPADWTVVLPEGWTSPHGLVARDFDGDGLDEILVVRRIAPEKQEDGTTKPAELQGWILDPPGKGD